MPAVWTCHLSCADCGKLFIINRVSLDEVFGAQFVLLCPYCNNKPSLDKGHRLIYLCAANLPYRRSKKGDVWHYSEYCSGWPLDDFVELDYPPAAEVCNECRALAGE